jgi:hypothetical protein
MFLPMKTNLYSFGQRAKTAVLLLSLTGVLGTASAAAPDATLSEKLEQGIYSEETKGDLDAAMKLYQEVVSEARGGQSLAAQAQYRLGVCYYKKKNYAEATATFEKLVKDYPDQKELVAMAQQYLAGTTVLLPAPWTDGEELRLDIKLPAGLKLGMASYTVRAGETAGRTNWQVGSRMFAGNVQSFSRVEVEADTFRPLHSRWKHSLLGDAQATYSSNHVDLKFAGKDEVKTVEFSGRMYDNEEVIQLMRRLPLAAGYKTELRAVPALAGGTPVGIKLDVSGPEKVEVPAGTYDCYRVELSIKQTFWYSTDPHRYLVKFEAGGALAELTAIVQHKPGDSVSYQDSAYHYSMTAPPDWIFYHSDDATDDANPSSKVLVLDPEADAISLVIVGARDNLAPEKRKSVRDWANQALNEGTETLKDFKVRPDGWQDRTVDGHPGLSVIGDFVEGKDKKIAYTVLSFGHTNVVDFTFLADAAAFDGLRPKFDAIVDSYKGN